MHAEIISPQQFQGCPPMLVKERTQRSGVGQKICIPKSLWILCKLTGPLYRFFLFTGFTPTMIVSNRIVVQLHGPYRTKFSGSLIFVYHWHRNWSEAKQYYDFQINYLQNYESESVIRGEVSMWTWMRKIICPINLNTKAKAKRYFRGINFTLMSVSTVFRVQWCSNLYPCTAEVRKRHVACASRVSNPVFDGQTADSGRLDSWLSIAGSGSWQPQLSQDSSIRSRGFRPLSKMAGWMISRAEACLWLACRYLQLDWGTLPAYSSMGGILLAGTSKSSPGLPEETQEKRKRERERERERNMMTTDQESRRRRSMANDAKSERATER